MSYGMKISLVVVILCLISSVSAKKTVGSVEEITTIDHIVDQETQSRVLVKLGIPSLPAKGLVEYAELTIPFSLEREDNVIMTIEGYRLTTEWQEESVTWSSPWTSAGGDFDTLSYCTYTFSSNSSDHIRLDITKIVSAWNDGASDFGLVLTRSYYEGDAFGSEAQDLVTALGEAEVAILYIKIPE